MEAPPRGKLVAGTRWVTQGKKQAAVQADVGGPVRADRGRALDVRGAKYQVGHLDLRRVERTQQSQLARTNMRTAPGVLGIHLVHRAPDEQRCEALGV